MTSCKEETSYISIKNRYSKPTHLWPKPTIDKNVEWKELDRLPTDELKLNKEEIDLGRTLFFDKRLSKSNTVSCASCHNPNKSWTDGLEKSPGHNSLLGDRNTQSLLNIRHFKRLFWDGRASSLENQVIGPLTNPKEMNISVGSLLKKINKINTYSTLFKEVYNSDTITIELLSKAIATFEKTILSSETKFDKFIKGDYNAMNENEVNGLHLFRTKGRCLNCHYGSLLSDQKFHNLGLVYYKREYEDLGLYQITKKAGDVGKFRTPSLRNVMKTGPWMHNGFVWEMEGVLSMYNAGMIQNTPTPEEAKDSLFPYTSKLLKPLGLSRKEHNDIIAFLHCLSEAE